MQAMADGGRLRVSIEERTEESTRRQGVQVSISDTGFGIDPKHTKRIFEPFFTTKDAKGTGLGLWISRGIIQKYEGTIRFRSLRLGAAHATCFSVFIPGLSSPKSVEPSIHRCRVEPLIMPADETVILCVDDEENPLVLRTLVLEKAGYHVITAPSAMRALEIISARHIDLVLSDQVMPGTTGTELARQIKSEVARPAGHPAFRGERDSCRCRF